MYKNLLNIALGHYGDRCKCPCCQEEEHQPESKVEEKEAPVVIPGTKTKMTTPQPTELTLTDFIDTYDDPDIDTLVGEYGELYEGKVIEIGLQEACALLGRTRISLPIRYGNERVVCKSLFCS